MAINSGSFAKALWPGVNAWYGQSYNDHATEYTDLFDTSTSRKAWEEDVGTSMFGLAAVKPEGAGINYDSARQGFLKRYTHVEYGLGFIITRIMVEDDQYDVIAKTRAQGLARSMRLTKEIVGANVYNRSVTAGYTGADGVVLLSAAHLNVEGANYSNITTAATLSESTLEDLTIDVMEATDDRGLNIALTPRCLIINPNLVYEADRILNSPLRVGTADNDLNALKNMGKFPEGIKVNHYITDTNAYWIRTDCPHGMKHIERRGDDFTSDNDFDTDNAKYKATGRYSFGWTDPRGLYGNMGA